MRTGFCNRPDHIAKPRAAFVKNGSELASSSRRSYCKVPPTGGLMTGAVLKPFEVSEDEVARLAAVELVQLIKRLIEADLQLWGAPLSAIQGKLKINISDGGEDVRVEWRGPFSLT